MLVATQVYYTEPVEHGADHVAHDAPFDLLPLISEALESAKAITPYQFVLAPDDEGVCKVYLLEKSLKRDPFSVGSSRRCFTSRLRAPVRSLFHQ